MNAAQESNTERTIARAGLLLALCIFGFCVWRSLFLIDDAFISFRYAKNWAEGHGLVYNVGIAAPVEGYSNFTWVALLAAGLRMGLPLESLAHVLSILSGAMTLVLVQKFLLCRLALDALRASLAIVALAALPSFHIWASGGLETSFFGLLLLVSWMLMCAPKEVTRLSHGALAGAFAGLLILTRAEGFLWVGGVFVSAWIAGGGLRLRRWAPFLAVALAIGLTHLAWRHSYYGSWLPNTVYAKGSLSGATLERGARTMATWGLSTLWPVLALAAPFLAPAGKTRRLATAAAVMIAGGLAYNIVVGGDWMPFFRFMAPLSAFMAVTLAVVLSRVGKRSAIALAVVGLLVAVLPAFDVLLAPKSLREALYFRQFRIGYQTEWQRWQTGHENTKVYTWTGRALAQVMTPQDTWTGGAIGAIGYYSGIQILGRNGLVNREVALRSVEGEGGTAGHEKRVPRVWFRDQSPTFYEALIYGSELPSSGPAFDKAVGRVHQAFIVDPKEQGLRDCTYVEARTVRDIPGLTTPATLLLLMHTPDRQKADAFWSRYGV